MNRASESLCRLPLYQILYILARSPQVKRAGFWAELDAENCSWLSKWSRINHLGMPLCMAAGRLTNDDLHVLPQAVEAFNHLRFADPPELSTQQTREFRLRNVENIGLAVGSGGDGG